MPVPIMSMSATAFILHEPASCYMSLPPVPDDFTWTHESWGAGLECVPLARIAPHRFTTRQLTLTSADDGRRLSEAIGATSIAWAKQVHGRAVIVVRRGRPPA